MILENLAVGSELHSAVMMAITNWACLRISANQAEMWDVVSSTLPVTVPPHSNIKLSFTGSFTSESAILFLWPRYAAVHNAQVHFRYGMDWNFWKEIRGGKGCRK